MSYKEIDQRCVLWDKWTRERPEKRTMLENRRGWQTIEDP